MNIEVIHLGIGTTHDDDFVYTRPRGTGGAWVFMYLPISLEIDTSRGLQRSRPDDCILHDPTFPQMHRSLPGGFHNDWMHFRGTHLRQVLRECRLPINELIRPDSTDFIRVTMFDLNRELNDRALHWQRRVAVLTADMLWQLSRQLNGRNEMHRTRTESGHLARMSLLRSQILTQFQRAWTVSEMARRVNLSEPRFSVLYRRFFKTSPNDDLIRSRIDHAKGLLAQSSLPIKTIAEQSGFESVYYFSRAFRRRVGCAPRDYLR